MNGILILLLDPPFLRVRFAAHASSAVCKLVPFVSVSLHPDIITVHPTKTTTRNFVNKSITGKSRVLRVAKRKLVKDGEIMLQI